MRVLAGVMLVGVVLVACAAAEAPSKPAASAPSRPATATRDQPAVDAPISKSDATEAELDVDAGAVPPPPSPERYAHAAHFPDAALVVASEWTKGHGVRARFREQRCWDAGGNVGIPPAAGLFCESTRQAKVPITTSRLFRLEGRQLRVVWEGVVATWANWLELTPVLVEGGVALVLHEVSPGRCSSALAESSEKEASGAQMDGLGTVLAGACAKVGRYEWDGKRYAGPGR